MSRGINPFLGISTLVISLFAVGSMGIQSLEQHPVHHAVYAAAQSSEPPALEPAGPPWG